MMLTTVQLVALKAAILADPVLSILLPGSDAAFVIAAAFNANADPAYYVWKTSLPTGEVMANGFDWTRVDNASVGKARIWEWMCSTGSINPAQANVRAGILAAFPANPADQPMRLAIFGHAQRLASRAEKLFATGTGSASTYDGIGPATATYEGQLSFIDVMDARNS